MREIRCKGIAINKKNKKRIGFKIPKEFSLESVEKIRKNLKIIELDGFDIAEHGATTDSICDVIANAIREGRSAEPPESQRAWSIQRAVQARADLEPDLEDWEKAQLVSDVLVRVDEIFRNEKTLEHVYNEELAFYKRGRT